MEHDPLYKPYHDIYAWWHGVVRRQDNLTKEELINTMADWFPELYYMDGSAKMFGLIPMGHGLIEVRCGDYVIGLIQRYRERHA